ncbi:MAG: phosphate ABC transporter permease PstA [Rhodothermaceae bacterium]
MNSNRLIKQTDAKQFDIFEFTIRIVAYSVFAVLFLFLGKLILAGGEVINWEFLTSVPKNNMTEGGIGPAIFGTLSVVVLMILMAVPVGICSAIYINEYSEMKTFRYVFKYSVNNLAGVPPVVFGLFGMSFFVLFVGNNLDAIFETGLLFGQPVMLWASATLAVLILPYIVIPVLDALEAIPASQREAALGLGASKWQMIKKVVLPQARPGIITGVILAVSRGIGETAPLLFLGCAFFMPNLPIAEVDVGLFSFSMINPLDQFMHLGYHIFGLATQSSHPELTRPIQYGTVLVLLLLTLGLNIIAFYYRYKFRKVLAELRGNS